MYNLPQNLINLKLIFKELQNH